MRSACSTTLVLGWLLVFSRDPRQPLGDWQPLGSFPSEYTCERGLSAEVDRDAVERIGRALADQPPDNPLREQAFRRARRAVEPRYRCVVE
jgi:hypothetical protein